MRKGEKRNMRKKAKFGNKKITLDGIQFDSKAEAAYYNQLKILKKAGEIKDFEMQVKFTLMDRFYHPTKTRKSGEPSVVGAITYTPDFIVEKNDGSKHVIDVKGHRTPIFNLKAKLFMRQYGIPIILAKRKGRGFEHVEV